MLCDDQTNSLLWERLGIFCCAIMMMRDRVCKRYIQFQYYSIPLYTYFIHEYRCVLYTSCVFGWASLVIHAATFTVPKTNMIIWAVASSQYLHPHAWSFWFLSSDSPKRQNMSLKKQVKQRCRNIKSDKTTDSSAIRNKVQRIIVLDCLFLRAGRSLSVVFICFLQWHDSIVHFDHRGSLETGQKFNVLFRNCQIHDNQDWSPHNQSPWWYSSKQSCNQMGKRFAHES